MSGRMVVVALGATVMSLALVACSSGSKSGRPTGAAATQSAAGSTKVPGTPGGLASQSPGSKVEGGGSATLPPGVSTPPAEGTASAGATSQAGTPAPDTTPGNEPTLVGGNTPPASTPPPDVSPTSGEPTFSLVVPSNPSGSFTVTVNFSGSAQFRGFNVQLTYDASVLRVTAVDHGSVLGGNDQQFCPPPQIEDGKTTFGCALLGNEVISANGSVAVFHFESVKAGASSLSLTRYTGDAINGSFLVDMSNAPLAVATVDSSVTVGG